MAAAVPSAPQHASPQDASQQSVWQWFGQFLAQDIAPYPGRAWTVARITIAATIVMIIIMVFRIPNAALGAYYTLLFARDSARATIVSVTRSVAAVSVSLLYVTLTVRLFAGEPFLHYIWVAGTLFITFFLISALSEYLAGTAFGFLAVTSIAAWDFPANTNVLFGNTLWTALAVLIGAVVTVAVELIARNVHPTDEMTARITDRLRVVETALRSLAFDRPLDDEPRQKLEQYAMLGTAALRQMLVRSSQDAQKVAETSAVVALTGRLIDLTANALTANALTVNASGTTVTPDEKPRFLEAADRLQTLRRDLLGHNTQAVSTMNTGCAPAPPGSFLADIQTTIERIPQVFSGLELTAYLPSAIDLDQPKGLFKDDAFSSVNHLHFALKGTLAALLCYTLYNSVDWRGLSSSVATCMITALSTVGSSRQKQLLRVAGAIIGGFGFGMLSQIFLLPYMDGIAAFTLLFAAVTAASAWVGTGSPRISYAGVQTAFAFYITQLRVFGPQTSLVVARDDVFGILFGLLVMWVTFDRLWAKDTVADMIDLFVGNLRRMARFNQEFETGDLRAEIDRIRRERALVTTTFDQIRNVSDSLIFEFGLFAENTAWHQKIQFREHLRRWQPLLRTLFLLQIALMQYRLQSEGPLPAAAQQCIDKSAEILSLLADLVDRHQQNERAAVQSQIDQRLHEYAETERPPDRTEPSQSVRLSHSMLGVAVSLAQEMRRPGQQPSM